MNGRLPMESDIQLIKGDEIMFMRFDSTCRRNVNSFLWVLLLVLMFHTNSSAQNNQTSTKKPTILVIGTYHMTDDAEDVTKPKRQREIEDLVTRLKNFRPTKIAVEALFDNAKVNESYSQYLSGTYQLSHNETNQIGFRLARELRHQKVYPIDWKNKFDLMPIAAFAGANDQGAVLQKGMARFTEADSQLNKLMKTATVLEIFRFLNNNQEIGEVDHIMFRTFPEQH